MNSEILDCFSKGNYQQGIDIANSNSITPANDPYTSNIVAACLFRLGRFVESYSLLENLESSLYENFDYLSLYGVTARRLGYLDKSEDLFTRALKLDSQNPALLNNYANLLIDLGKHDKARSILSKLVEEYPQYQDAKINFDRLNVIIENNHHQEPFNSRSPSDALKDDDTSNSNDLLSLDPLSMAFAEEEVRLHGRMKSDSSDSGSSKSVSDNLPSIDQKTIAVEKLRLAEKAISENNSDFALQLCSEALSVAGPLAAIYDCAGDAYIQKKMYSDAELMYLQVATIENPTLKQYVNLASLSIIRKDFLLAQTYIDRVASLSPSDPHIQSLNDQLAKAKTNSQGNPFTF